MPGIAGIISRRTPEQSQRLVEAMVQSMQSEPFYTSGTCFVPEVGVYGGWVAHQGSFAARQSAHADSDVRLLFSGECFQPCQSSDVSTCHDPRSKESDLDQLLKLYHERGDSFVGEINGLFSGLLIDRKKKRALLFNDRYGIERIYFFEKNGTTFFASEAKALLRVVPELRAFDDEGVAQFLTFGCTLNGQTLFNKVRFLPGGSVLTFDESGKCSKDRYFVPSHWESQPLLSQEDYEKEFITTFNAVLPRYLSSEVPIGISLTGGLDTRMIMACLTSMTINPLSYTFLGITGHTLDSRLAEEISKVCGLEHQNLRIGADFLANYGRFLDKTVFVTDGCAGALTTHEIYFNCLGRDLSPIRLTGNFGSEIFRSMSTFKPINLDVGLFNSGFSTILNNTLQHKTHQTEHQVTFAAFKEIPWNLYGSLAAGKSQLTFRTPYLDNDLVALAYRAPQKSRISPNSALRLIHDSNRVLGEIPTDRGIIWQSNPVMHTLRRIFSEITFKLDYMHKEGLPNNLASIDPFLRFMSNLNLLGLHKFLPYRIWFRNELSTYMGDTLTSAHTMQSPYWNSDFLKAIVDDHIKGRKNYLREIHAILTLEATHRVLIKGCSGLIKTDTSIG